MADVIINVIVVLTILGWVVLGLEWIGLTAPRRVSNKWDVCPRCLANINPGDRISQDKRGRATHWDCI